MHRWTSLIGALMLVLMLWTGGAAHAAERINCLPVTAEAAGHFDGDEDQSPSGSHQGVARHHCGCSDHQTAAADDESSAIMPVLSRALPFAWKEAGKPGRSPDAQLRPPQA